MQPRSGTGSLSRSPLRHLAAISWSCVLSFFSIVSSATGSTNDTTSSRTTVLKDGDPINMGIGEFTFLETLSNLGGPLPLKFQFYYGSARNTRRLPDGLPFKFSHNLHGYLVHDTAANTIALEPGLAAESGFFKVGNEWRSGPEESINLQLVESGDFYYVCDPVQELVSIFQRTQVNGTEITAVLRVVLDRNGNRLTFENAISPTLQGPTSVQDGLGRSYTLEYGTVGTLDTGSYLRTLTDQGGRVWRFLYEDGPADAPGRVTLRSVVAPDGQAHTFRYDTNGFHFIHSLTRPRGNTPSRQQYRHTRPEDAFRGFVEAQQDPENNTWRLSADVLAPFENPITRLSLTQPDGSQRGFLHGHFGRVIRRFTDEDGRSSEYASDPLRDRVTSVIDRRGQTHQVFHHPSGKIAAFINARGSRLALSYASRQQVLLNPINGEPIPCEFFELSRMDHPDGSSESFEYDNRGNLIATIDRTGALTRFAYNARGQVITTTNATDGVIQFDYDAHANLISITDSDGVVTRYGYDALFRRTSVTNADGTSIHYERDALDRLTAVVDENSTRLALEYDFNGNLVRITRAAGTALAQTRQLEYDDLDRLKRALDPAGFATTLAYTYRGALAEAVFPDASRIQIGYDQRQFPVQFVDEAGKVVRLDRDPEGLPTLLRTPEGRQFRAAFDAVGFPVELLDAQTNRFRLDYDVSLRLTNLVDALGRSIGSRRDAEGRLTALTVPILGTTHYQRNGLGQITRVSDFRGSEWNFEYSPMGRIKTVRDPLANTWSVTYDSRGRLHTIAHPDGVTETNLYDATSGLIRRNFSTGLQLEFTRDALRRIIGSSSVPVQRNYDVRDLTLSQTLHGTTFTASYDSRQRLESLQYDTLSTISYTYDTRGLVSRVSDSRTSAFIEFDYDDDRFLVRLRRSNGVNTLYERDRNGRVVRIQHVGKADMKLTRNASGDVVRSVVSGILNIASHLPAEAVTFAYDHANQPTGAGFSQDARGRRTQDPKRSYTWDAADRLVTVRQGDDIVQTEFTATGEVAAESIDGTSTQFFFHDAIPNRPVLAERRSGSFHRYYIYAPDGSLLFAVEVPVNAPSFHHFDDSGTTLFLTGANGSVTDSYGYTPYGRLVRHEGTSDQPFTFHGELGVRQVGNTALFHMGARFYDSWTARFLSRDPSWLKLLEVHTELNPYGFARQNPVRFADPTGHRTIPSLSSILEILNQRETEPGNIFAQPDANGFVNFGLQREQSERAQNEDLAGLNSSSTDSFPSGTPFRKPPHSIQNSSDPTGFVSQSLATTQTGQNLEEIIASSVVRRQMQQPPRRVIRLNQNAIELSTVNDLDALRYSRSKDSCVNPSRCSLTENHDPAESRMPLTRGYAFMLLLLAWWIGRGFLVRSRS